MRLVDNVAHSLIRWAERRKPPRLEGGSLGGMPLWTDWSTEAAIKEGYKAHYALYSVVSDLSDCIRSVPWVVKKFDGKTDTEVEDGPLVDLLRDPNPSHTWGSLCEVLDLHKSLAGNGILYMDATEGSIHVWTLRPDRVQPILDTRGHLKAYRYTVDGQYEDFDVSQILHFRFVDPGNEFWGMAPLQAAARLVDTSNAAIDWNKSSMDNRARMDGMFSPKVPLDDTQYLHWRTKMKEQLQGPKNAHKILINPFEAKFESFEMSPMEMDFVKSFETYEIAICKAFHVHPEALGTLGATFENKRWAIRAKWEGPVESRLREMRAVLNKRLSVYGTSWPASKGGLFLDYDLSNTPAVQESRRELSEEAQRYFAMGVPFNVVSEVLDLPFDPIPGGDVGYLPVSMLPLGTSRERSGTRDVRARRLSEGEQEALWRTVDRKKQGWERGVAVKVAAEFGKDRRAVVDAIRGGTVDVDTVIDGRRAGWAALIEAVLRAVIEDFGQKTIDDLTRDWNPWSVAVQKWVATKTAEHIAYIADKTKDRIQKVIGAGIAEGRPLEDIANDVDDVFIDWADTDDAAITTSRAFMIARTEVHTAASYGMHEAAGQSGVVREKAWLSSFDPPRAREDHMAISGIWIPYNEPFVMPDGARMQYPGDGPAHHVIQCRCVLQYRD